jgi:DNA-binding transcriptional regulator YiaG
VYGHVLSIYEKTDKTGSCGKLAKKRTETTSFKEIVIETGLSHGAFYRPLATWVNPVKTWQENEINKV